MVNSIEMKMGLILSIKKPAQTDWQSSNKVDSSNEKLREKAKYFIRSTLITLGGLSTRSKRHSIHLNQSLRLMSKALQHTLLQHIRIKGQLLGNRA